MLKKAIILLGISWLVLTPYTRAAEPEAGVLVARGEKRRHLARKPGLLAVPVHTHSAPHHVWALELPGGWGARP